jgi:predicted alpha/beta-fold hydrolase
MNSNARAPAVGAAAAPAQGDPKPPSFWSHIADSVLAAIGMHAHDYTKEDDTNSFQLSSWRAPDGTQHSTHSVSNCQYDIRSLSEANVRHAYNAVNQQGLTKSEDPQDWSSHEGIVRGVANMVAWQFVASQKSLPDVMLRPDNYEHCEVHFPDGGASCLHLYTPPAGTMASTDAPASSAAASATGDPRTTTPVMLLCPALTSNHSDYLLFIEFVVMKLGWSVAVANRRSLCIALKTPVFHIMGSDDDLHAMVLHLQSKPKFQDRPILAVGFSIGGNWLMRYLGKFNGPENRIVAAATISSPLNLKDVLIRQGFMADYMLARLKHKYLDKSKALFDQTPRSRAIYDNMLRAPTLQTLAYAHAHMFLVTSETTDTTPSDKSVRETGLPTTSADAHSQSSSGDDIEILLAPPEEGALAVDVDVHKLTSLDDSINATVDAFDTALWVQHVRVPMLVFMSKDDPIVTTTPANVEAMTQNPNIVRMLTVAGGHCMFRDDVAKSHIEISRAEGITLNFLRNVLTSRSSTDP